MIRPLLLVCLVLNGACAADSESYIDRLTGISLLLGEFESYSSEQTVRAVLGPHPIQDVERSSLSPGDKRPRFDQVTLAVAEYQHLGATGELRLELFNDRLMSVWFFPSDIDAYLKALAGRDVAVLPSGRSVGTLRVWSQPDFRARVYVGWSDGRLEDQSARWISRYS